MANAAQNVMLAHKWEDKVDPTGWWMSEKLDGVRCYWSGSKLYSRQGNEFLAPDYWKKDLPKEPLDGELWCGRGLFQKTLSIVRRTVTNSHTDADWKYVTFLVFDAPARSEKHKMEYEDRVRWLERTIQVRKPNFNCSRATMPSVSLVVLLRGAHIVTLPYSRSSSVAPFHCAAASI